MPQSDPATTECMTAPPGSLLPLRRAWTSDRVLLFAVAFASLGAVCARMDQDVDLWGHLLYGLEHLRLGRLPRIDPYNYTAPQAPWTNHEWLCELSFAWCWKHLGVLGLWGLRVVLAGVSLGLVVQSIYESTRGFWGGVAIYILCWVTMTIGYSFRPQLYTLAAFAVTLFIIRRIYVQKIWPIHRSLLFVPLLALWTNLHGGFLVGVAVLLFLAGHQTLCCLTGRVSRARLVMTLAATCLALLSTLANPYGIQLWTWLVRALGTPRSEEITEWRTVVGHSSQIDLIGYYGMVVLAAIAWFRSPRRKELLEWGLLLCTGVMAWLHVRHVVLFCMLAAMVLPRHLEALVPRLARPSTFPRGAVVLLAAALAAVGVGVHLPAPNRPQRIIVPVEQQPFCAFQFIVEQGLRGHLLCKFNWSQAALWHLSARCRVAFDGRFRTVYPPEVEADYVRFAWVQKEWANLLDRYDTHIVLVDERWPGVEKMARRQDWRCVYRSAALYPPGRPWPVREHAVIYVKRGRFPELESRLDRGEVQMPRPRTAFLFGEAL